MLAFVSDLHLTDGTTSTTVHPSAFSLLRREVVDAARDKGAGKAAVTLVLLGDIFDVLRTDWWFRNTRPEERPWNGPLDLQRTAMNSNTAAIETQYGRILEDILAHASTRAFVAEVQKIGAAKGIASFDVVYVTGNHDRALNNFPSLQRRIQQALGVKVTFCDSFADPEYGVVARHGHQWDENCSAKVLLSKVLRKDRAWKVFDSEIGLVQNLGEVVTAELMSGLVWRVKEAHDAVLSDIVRDVDLLRPMTKVFQWVEWRARGVDARRQDILASALRESLSGVVDSAFGKLWDKVKTDLLVSGDLVDRLELARGRLKADGYRGLREIVLTLVAFNNLASSVVPQKAEDFEGAREEFKNPAPGIQYLIYGHTHRAQYNYFSGSPDGTARMYVNTGTYLPVIELSEDGRTFARSQRMTLAFAYKKDEDTQNRADEGPTLDVWNGVKHKNYV